MLDLRQDMAREQVALGCMGIARQDERFDPFRLIGAQLGQHLIRIADDGRAAT